MDAKKEVLKRIQESYEKKGVLYTPLREEGFDTLVPGGKPLVAGSAYLLFSSPITCERYILERHLPLIAHARPVGEIRKTDPHRDLNSFIGRAIAEEIPYIRLEDEGVVEIETKSILPAVLNPKEAKEKFLELYENFYPLPILKGISALPDSYKEYQGRYDEFRLQLLENKAAAEQYIYETFTFKELIDLILLFNCSYYDDSFTPNSPADVFRKGVVATLRKKLVEEVNNGEIYLDDDEDDLYIARITKDNIRATDKHKKLITKELFDSYIHGRERLYIREVSLTGLAGGDWAELPLQLC